MYLSLKSIILQKSFNSKVFIFLCFIIKEILYTSDRPQILTKLIGKIWLLIIEEDRYNFKKSDISADMANWGVNENRYEG